MKHALTTACNHHRSWTTGHPRGRGRRRCRRRRGWGGGCRCARSDGGPGGGDGWCLRVCHGSGELLDYWWGFLGGLVAEGFRRSGGGMAQL